jgi:anaerobic dimethyl sulfoxide reductase subunit B (iron-sulfur subunit)
MGKCDFCQDLLAQGEDPACVATCPMRALGFGELEQLISKTGTVKGIEPLPEPGLTNPSLVITPHRDAQLSGTGTGHVLNLPEEL